DLSRGRSPGGARADDPLDELAVRPAIAEIVAAGTEHERRAGGDQGPGRLDLVDRAERIRRSVDEHDADAELWKVRRARLTGTAGRMEWIGKQQETADQIGLLGGEHAGLTTAIRQPSEEHALDPERLHGRHRVGKPGPIDRCRRPRWRPRASR